MYIDAPYPIKRALFVVRY